MVVGQLKCCVKKEACEMQSEAKQCNADKRRELRERGNLGHPKVGASALLIVSSVVRCSVWWERSKVLARRGAIES